ncbi:glutaredoxin [Sporolactobacillus sp. THM7-4]|nr:glutaredoxin [Sporolactobacillus sp. THM7-4]
MTDKKIALVTKQGCPYCKRAKSILNQDLNGKYNDQIDLVEQETDAGRFRQLQDQYQFQTVPTFIDQENGEILSASQEDAITQFLKEHLAG